MYQYPSLFVPLLVSRRIAGGGEDQLLRGAHLSIRDPFYAEIEHVLETVHLDTDLFERLAAELVESKGYSTNLAVGGADNGYDFEILDTSLEPGPGVATTSNRVTANLKRNLDRNKANCPQAAKKTFIVTSSVLTSKKRDNLKKAAAERGYKYLGAADLHEVARYIYANPQWAQKLLGLTGQPSTLSVVPRTSRPLVDIPLIGRESADKRLRNIDRDTLLVGSPGCGKTALLARIVADGLGSFMVSTDMTAVANAIRQQKPQVIIIDDLKDVAAATRDLVQLRVEMGADFKIVVTDWEANPELQQALGLTDADVVTLGQLTRDEIVSVVRSVGVGGPNQLVREVVDQTEGIPGLAVTLTQVALAGDYRDLFDGNCIGTLVGSTVNRLLGNPREGDRAVLALGSIALAGDAGLTLEEIADFVGVPKNELQGLLMRLTSGGVIRSVSRRVTLRPRPLRRYMIRKAFFGAGAADYAPLLSIVPNPGQTATELVLATRAGAVVPGLLGIVVSSGDTKAARYFVSSGERQAREFVEAAPVFAIHVAREALHTAPDAVIPILLALAVGDSRELHNTPEQPLRLIKDWANSGMPGSGKAVARKRIVVTSALRWAANGNDFDTACRACSEVLCTVFEGSETDPGAGMTFHLMNGMLTDEEVEQLSSIWGEIRDAIEGAGDAPWPSLLSMCWDLVHPHVFSDHPSEAFEASRRLGELVIRDVGSLAAAHSGVLERLNAMRMHLGHGEFYPIPEDYAVLLGERDSGDWRRDEEGRTKRTKQLAATWSAGDPDRFASRLKWLHSEAAVAGMVGYDGSPFLCRLLAQKVDHPGRWMSALTAAGLSPACLLPFLERAVQDEESGWESVILPILNDQELESAPVDVALRAPRLSDAMWSALSPKLPRHHQLIHTLCLRGQVPLATLRQLLHDDSTEVTHATAVGMWTGETHGAIPDELRQEWEDAVVGIDDDEYWLEEMLASSPAMAARWLMARIENNDWRALRNRKNVRSACRGLDDMQRLDMLLRLPDRFHRRGVVASLIGDSDELYRQLLRDQTLGDHWKDPLQIGADETWRKHAGIALEEGRTPQEIAAASMLRSGIWGGPYSAHLQGQIEEFAVWLDDPNTGIREIAGHAIEWLSESRERALVDERREAIEGLG